MNGVAETKMKATLLAVGRLAALGLIALLAAPAVHAQASAAATPHAAASAPAADAPAEMAEPPPRQPRYLLRGPGGRAVTSEDFRGKLQIVTFGFTTCPDVCPTTLVELQQLLRALGPRAARVQAIFVTVDPARDTPQVLAAYTEAFDPRIVGLGGPEALVQRAAESFGVVYRKVQEAGAAPGAYTMDHSAGLYVLGPDGLWLGRIGYGTPVPEIVRRVEEYIDAAFSRR